LEARLVYRVNFRTVRQGCYTDKSCLEKPKPKNKTKKPTNPTQANNGFI
jgi:hypothetical protein